MSHDGGFEVGYDADGKLQITEASAPAEPEMMIDVSKIPGRCS
jgi:hypothetical protein